MATGTNNNVGKNEIPAKDKDDLQFDLAPIAGTDVVVGKTGKLYDVAALKAIIVARGAVYHPSLVAFAATDDLVEVEVDLKAVGGHGIDEGDQANGQSTATTSDAFYKNNGSWTDMDPMGGRQDGEPSVTKLPTSFQELFVENGSIVTVHTVFQAV